MHERLLEVLRRPDTVVFVGSGVSVWSGLPTWTRLLLDLAEYLDVLGRSSALVLREVENHDLLQAASYGFDLLTPHERCEFLRRECLIGTAQPSRLHSVIAELGPTCFVTTNYDQLLEAALGRSTSIGHIDVVTEASVVELASISQARAQRFLFKPHGDVGNCQSVVITREDYRRLRQESRGVMSAYRTLLTSRPIIYIGFGLRDPDFLLLKETVAADFAGAPQDHYAIVPDVSPQEVTYWQRHYGIHITPYVTDPSNAGDGGMHTGLLTLLEELKTRASAYTKTDDGITESEPDIALVLARYARGLTRTAAPVTDYPVVPLNLNSRTQRRSRPHGRPQTHRRLGEAVDFLAQFQGKCAIIGPPGSGKTFTAKQTLVRLAKSLEDACLDPSRTADEARVPVYVELRDYRGDVEAQIRAQLPPGTAYERALAAGTLVLFVDGLNEVPTEFVTQNRVQADLQNFMDKCGTNTVLVFSRMAEELTGLDLDELELDEVPSRLIASRLSELGVQPDSEVVGLLQRPMFYRTWTSSELDWSTIRSANAVYSQLVGLYARQVAQRIELDVTTVQRCLGDIAFEMIDRGDLTTTTAQTFAAFRRAMDQPVALGPLVAAVLDAGAMLPTGNRRLTFPHHSIAEYHAASTLAARLGSDPGLAARCITRRSWDQTILLTLGFLDAKAAHDLLETVFATDADLGIRSLSYLDHDREYWTGVALDLLLVRASAPGNDTGVRLGWSLMKMQLTESALPQLRQLEELGDSIGGSAAAHIWRVGSREDRARIRDWFVKRPSDYNFLNRLAEGISEEVDAADVLEILSAVAATDLSGLLDREEPYVALSSSLGELLGTVPFPRAYEAIEPLANGGNSGVLSAILLDRCRGDRSLAALRYVVEQVRAEPTVDGAVFALYMQLGSGLAASDVLAVADTALVDRLAEALWSPEYARWALGGLRRLLTILPELRHSVEVFDARGSKLLPLLLRYALGDSAAFVVGLEALLGSTDWTSEPVHALAEISEVWADNTGLLVSLIRERDAVLTEALLQNSEVRGFGSALARVPLEDAGEWLDWVEDGCRQGGFQGIMRAEFVGVIADGESVAKLLGLVVAAKGGRRLLLTRLMLPTMPDLALDDLEPTFVDWLVDNLDRTQPFLGDHPLASLVTERFVVERLLPRLAQPASDDYTVALRRLLRACGQRHGRRYLDEESEILG